MWDAEGWVADGVCGLHVVMRHGRGGAVGRRCRVVGLVTPCGIIITLSEIDVGDSPLSQTILKVVVEGGVLIDGVKEGAHECGFFLVEQRVTRQGRWVGKCGEVECVCVGCGESGVIELVVVERCESVKGSLFHQVGRNLKGCDACSHSFSDKQIIILWEGR